MRKKQQGPMTPTYETYNEMIGERNQAVADWPAAPLSQTSQEVGQILVQCDPDSAVNVRVGGADNQYIVLRPGESITLPFNNPNGIYVEGVNGAGTINWIALT